MSLRVRLVLAFLLLAVVPLSGLTLQSYLTSRRALRRAVEAEAAERARDMTDRLESVTADLGRRLETVSHLPLGTLLEDGGAAREHLLGELQARMGEDAGLVDSLSIVPAPPTSGPALAPVGAPKPRAAAKPRAPVVEVPDPAPAVPPDPAGVVVMPEPPVAAETSEPDPRPGLRRWVVRLPARVGRIHALERRAERLRQAGDQAGYEKIMTELGIESAEIGVEAGIKAVESIASLPWIAGRGKPPAPPSGNRAHQPAPPTQELEAGERAAEAARQVEEAARRVEEAARERRDQEAAVVEARRDAAQARREAAAEKKGLLGRHFDYTFWRDGTAAGKVRAEVKPQEVLERVFSKSRRESGELPFAVDGEGKLHAAGRDRERLASLPLADLAAAPPGQETRRTLDEWVIVARRDPASGLTLGIARPIGQSLKEIRNAAFTNLAYGLGIAGLALFGILPLSRRMTRDLGLLSAGAERLATGDLEARVTVRSRDEIGRLAATFNRMAEDLRTNQDRLLAEERLRKELEMCRRIQEEMLPHDPLRSAFVEVKGVSLPAREVGGDFFNYFLLPTGEAALLVGDVAGKGVAAALLMANLQATLRARLPLEPDLASLATHLDLEIEKSTPTAAYLTLFMAVLDGNRGRLRYVNAGHNPPFLLHGSGGVEALGSTGRPLGLLSGGGYEQAEVLLQAGDSLFLYTDGIVESEDASGESFGMERLQDVVVAERKSGLDGILARVEEAVRTFRGRAEADDDATMLVVKFAGATAATPLQRSAGS